MADQPGIELSMLDAIQLFNNRPAAEWTPEELAAFRARMEATPNVVTLLGGRDKIERKLAEVAAAHTRAAAAPVAAVVEPGAAAVVPIHRDSKLLRRSLEVVLLLTLVLGAGYWTWTQLRSVLPKPVATLNPDGTKPATAAGVPANGAPKNPATTAAGAKPARPRVVNPDEPLVETWHDWTIVGTKDGRWTRVSEWDLTQPNAPTPVERLTLEGSATPGATVTLSQRRPLLKDERWLELRARAMKPVAKPGAITVRLNGKTVAQMKVSGAEARWPVYAPLESAGSGKESVLEVVYETGEAGEQFAWRNLAFAPEKREVAKRINCGGPLVEAATGDWEADDKGNPALASTGTQIWSVKVPVNAPDDLLPIYQTERWAYRFIDYVIPVEPGRYEVVLHFAETNPAFMVKGKRQFDIRINGETVAEKYDIFGTAGSAPAAGAATPGTATACQFRRRIEVKDNKVAIGLYANPTGPAIKGIEILALPKGQ